MKLFKRHKDYGFFDQDIRLSRLTELGDPLVILKAGVDFNIFKNLLEEHLVKMPKGKGGRRPYDYVLMFKIVILQRYYNLSDVQIEYQINDRMSFMRFLELTISDDIPDSKTVWNFREQITDLGLVEKLFELFIKELTKMNLIVHEGKIVDASFVEVPKQRNSKDENGQIKEGQIPESFQQHPKRLSHKDTDARWVTKDKVNYYGYKNHIKVDSNSKLITNYTVTDASVHDSQELENLLEAEDKRQPLYGDSAYTGKEQENKIVGIEMSNEVCEKGYRNHPLTQEQRDKNKTKSKVRCRVEHAFGFMEMSMNGMYLNAIGIKRIESLIGLINLTYNMFRKIQLAG